MRDKKENLKERNEKQVEVEKYDKKSRPSFEMLPFISHLMWCNCVPFCLAGPAKVIFPQPNLQQDTFPLGCKDGTFLARQVEVCDSDLEDMEGSI